MPTRLEMRIIAQCRRPTTINLNYHRTKEETTILKRNKRPHPTVEFNNFNRSGLSFAEIEFEKEMKSFGWFRFPKTYRFKGMQKQKKQNEVEIKD